MLYVRRTLRCLAKYRPGTIPPLSMWMMAAILWSLLMASASLSIVAIAVSRL